MLKKEALIEVERLLSRSPFMVERNVSFHWITNRVPANDTMPPPPRVQYRLTGVHTRLGGDWEQLMSKKKAPLRFDFQVNNTILIEIDHTPHFSSARMTTLGFYDGLEHNLDIETYAVLCKEFAKEADKYQQNRSASDFPVDGGRSAQRAYFDIAKDLLSAANGFRLLRIPVPSAEHVSRIDLTLRVLI